MKPRSKHKDRKDTKKHREDEEKLSVEEAGEAKERKASTRKSNPAGNPIPLDPIRVMGNHSWTVGGVPLNLRQMGINNPSNGHHGKGDRRWK